jgi:hypothetical protein
MERFEKLVWALFLAMVLVRLVLAFSSPYFDYDSYFHIRHIESITNTGIPEYNDALSYGGGFFIFSPLFHYIIAAFSFIMPIGIAGKIIPNIAFALLIPLAYYIAYEITGSKKISLFAPLFIAFMPALWSTIFTLSPLCLAIPAIFYAFYCLVKKDGKNNIPRFLTFIILASLISPVSIITIPVVWLYILFIKIEKIETDSALVEAAIFSTFFILLMQFIFYKNAILVNGSEIIWQNVPLEIIKNYFININILDIIANIGILPFIFGLYEIFVFSFEKKERVSALFISVVLVLGVLIWLKLIALGTGIILLGVGISIISIATIKHSLDYFDKIKFKRIRYVIAAIIIIFLLSAVFPSFYYWNLSKNNLPAKSEVDALLWLRENSNENSVVAGSVKDGFIINAVAGRKNIIDGNFLMSPEAGERLKDISAIYKTNFETMALELLNKYGAKYIFFGKNAKTDYNVTELGFEDRKCFTKVFDEENVSLYKTWCELE